MYFKKNKNKGNAAFDAALHFHINGFIILVKQHLKFTPILNHSHPIIKEINNKSRSINSS